MQPQDGLHTPEPSSMAVSSAHSSLASPAFHLQVLKGKQDERTARAFVKEMAILRSCLHPQILQYMVRSLLLGCSCLHSFASARVVQACLLKCCLLGTWDAAMRLILGHAACQVLLHSQALQKQSKAKLETFCRVGKRTCKQCDGPAIQCTG